MLERFQNGSPDSRTGMIFFAWLTRGINLAEVSEHNRQQSDRLRELGATPVNIPIYYYLYAAEVPIIELFERHKTLEKGSIGHSIGYALMFHWYTNLAVSYPAEGYDELVRRLWSALIQNYTDINEVVGELAAVLNNPSMKKQIINNDVSIAMLTKDPKIITPHFMVPGHALSVKLLEEGKLKYQFATR